MNELDLMDKSKNDYQLVTELSKIVRSYKNKNKPVDRNFVDSVLLSCIKNDVVDVKNGIKSSDDNDVLDILILILFLSIIVCMIVILKI